MRTPSTLALLLFAMMTACSDYQLDAHKGDESGGTDDDVVWKHRMLGHPRTLIQGIFNSHILGLLQANNSRTKSVTKFPIPQDLIFQR